NKYQPLYNDKPSVICVWDADTGSTRILQAGRTPTPTLDGKAILAGWGRSLYLFDARSGAVITPKLQIKGRRWLNAELLGSLSGGRVLYEGLPTTKPDLAASAPSASGEEEWTIKVADLAKGTFCTVATGIASRAVAYSPVRIDLDEQPK